MKTNSHYLVVTIQELKNLLAYAESVTTPHLSKDGRNIAAFVVDLQQSGEEHNTADGQRQINFVQSFRHPVTAETLLPVS